MSKESESNVNNNDNKIIIKKYEELSILQRFNIDFLATRPPIDTVTRCFCILIYLGMTIEEINSYLPSPYSSEYLSSIENSIMKALGVPQLSFSSSELKSTLEVLELAGILSDFSNTRPTVEDSIESSEISEGEILRQEGIADNRPLKLKRSPKGPEEVASINEKREWQEKVNSSGEVAKAGIKRLR